MAYVTAHTAAAHPLRMDELLAACSVLDHAGFQPKIMGDWIMAFVPGLRVTGGKTEPVLDRIMVRGMTDALRLVIDCE